ncbi:MAG: pilus assembly protein PilP, partial [Nitrospirae bacterium]|nr:pilus assembly protein PilP [Nitrospirota bacterium]
TPLIAAGSDKGKKARTGTLEGYDINDFTLAAIAEKKGVRYGLLLSPDNKSYTVKEGTVLGLHKGMVKKITNDKVIINEYIIDYTGKTRPREIVLQLRRGKEAE